MVKARLALLFVRPALVASRHAAMFSCPKRRSTLMVFAFPRIVYAETVPVVPQASDFPPSMPKAMFCTQAEPTPPTLAATAPSAPGSPTPPLPCEPPPPVMEVDNGNALGAAAEAAAATQVAGVVDLVGDQSEESQEWGMKPPNFEEFDAPRTFPEDESDDAKSNKSSESLDHDGDDDDSHGGEHDSCGAKGDDCDDSEKKSDSEPSNKSNTGPCKDPSEEPVKKPDSEWKPEAKLADVCDKPSEKSDNGLATVIVKDGASGTSGGAEAKPDGGEGSAWDRNSVPAPVPKKMPRAARAKTQLRLEAALKSSAADLPKTPALRATSKAAPPRAPTPVPPKAPARHRSRSPPGEDQAPAPAG